MPAPVFSLPITENSGQFRVGQAAFESALNSAFGDLYDEAVAAQQAAATNATAIANLPAPTVAATLSEIPANIPTGPFFTGALLTQGASTFRSAVGYFDKADVRRWGAVMSDFFNPASQAVATANLTALQAALDWSAATGGVVQVPAGVLDIYGTITLPAGAAIRGASQYSTVIRQRRLPTSLAESFYSIFIAPTVSGSTGGNGFNVISDLTLDGGWNKRNFDGETGTPNWAHDPARMTQKLLECNTPSNGPPATTTRETNSDAQSRIFAVSFRNCAGQALHLRGRGEIFCTNLEFHSCATYSIYHESPDCFFHGITSYKTGNSGMVIRSAAGNFRLTNSKFWFTGMQSGVECAGATGTAGRGGNGIEMPDAGTLAVLMDTVSIQDTWGPSLDLNGDTGIVFRGDLDNAGGGRVESQGFGWAGTRTLPRSFVRLAGTMRRAEITAQIRGGAVPSGALPHLLDLRGSSVEGCEIKFNGALGSINTTRVNVMPSHTNANRYNEVWFGKRLLHGYVTQAMLDLVGHGVNDPDYGPTQVLRTDGRIVCRSQAGAWVVATDGAPGADGDDGESITVLTFAAGDQAGYDAAVTANASNPLVLVVRYA